MTEQQMFLMLGIWELSRTFQSLKKLNFSNCVLNQINEIVDDLVGLVEDEAIKKILLSSIIGYDDERNRFYVKE